VTFVVDQAAAYWERNKMSKTKEILSESANSYFVSREQLLLQESLMPNLPGYKLGESATVRVPIKDDNNTKAGPEEKHETVEEGSVPETKAKKADTRQHASDSADIDRLNFYEYGHALAEALTDAKSKAPVVRPNH
jgi:hypothetical protein